MPNLVALGHIVSEKIFKDLKDFKNFLLSWQPEFLKESISKNSEKDNGRNISVIFHQNAVSSFREEDV